MTGGWTGAASGSGPSPSPPTGERTPTPHWGFNADPAYLPHYHDAARGHRDFVAHIDDGLEDYLRGYLFWLEQRREPRDGEALPLLRG